MNFFLDENFPKTAASLLEGMATEFGIFGAPTAKEFETLTFLEMVNVSPRSS